MAERRAKRVYRVIAGTAVRLSRDRTDPLWDQFVEFEPGQIVTEGSYPDWANVAGWLASGHWQVVEPGGGG